LLMHGTADEILPDACSRDIYARANDPKQILLYPGCRHGLDECRDQVDQDLLRWLKQSLTSIASWIFFKKLYYQKLVAFYRMK